VTTSLLQLTQVSKAFGAVQALKNVSFDLQPGEVHALLGENGAGKSTLIKIITGAHRPDSGEINIGGGRVPQLTPAAAHKLGIACIYQQPALFPDLTVAENIALRLEPASGMRRVKWGERHTRAAELLKRIGANIPCDTEARSLSMPEQQLVEIACAVGAGARIVIMDEPTASLTQREVELLFTIVRELRSAGIGIIYISHRLEEIFALADRVTVLRDGESVVTRTIARGSSAEGNSSPPALTESELVKLMVGREISHLYPAQEGTVGEVVLSAQNLGYSFSGVHNVTFDVRAGEILGLAGLVGAGRTELARVLFGITPADSGTITFAGEQITLRSPREAAARGIAYVPEDRRRHGVMLDLPIAHNVTMAIHRKIFRGSWLRPRRENALTLDFIRSLGVKTESPLALGNSLSGGNQQKISLARWLAAEPKVLILDEPTQGVDVGAKSEIHKIIRGLAQQGLAVVLISSDLPEVLGMSDRIAVMRGGTIVSMLPGKSDAHTVMSAALGQTTEKR
jgi:rhamnose transport system ATP-binding protein